MSSSTNRQRSYTLINPHWVKATVLPRAPRPSQRFSAELREIATIGAKFLVQGPPQVQYESLLILESSRLPHILELPIEMHWARPNAAGNWLMGCGFDPPLSDVQFDALLNSGLLERRAAVRWRTRIAVEAQWLADKPRVPALVCDLSEGGLCLTAAQPPDGKHDIAIFGQTDKKEVRIALHVRWSMSVGPNYFIGCEFVHRSDLALLRKMQPGANRLRTHLQAILSAADADRV